MFNPVIKSAALAVAILLSSDCFAACPPKIVNGKTVAMSADECKAWIAMQPGPEQIARSAALSTAMQGIQIVSKSTPALNATYPVGLQEQVSMLSEQLSILSQGTFSDGATTLAWKDNGGAYHVFPTTESFSAFSKAFRAYVAGLERGHAPTNPVAIP
jgi:hypothetical protein